MRLCLQARDVKVGDELVGRGKVVSVVRDAAEVVVATQFLTATLNPEHEVWVERSEYVPQPTRVGPFA